MRTSVFVGISLDGFIARSNGAFDFLSGAEGEPHGYDEFFATVDAIVMGRNTVRNRIALSEVAIRGEARLRTKHSTTPTSARRSGR